MMNMNTNHGPGMPQATVPLYPGRRQHEMAYNQQLPQAQYPPQAYYHHAMPQHYHPQPPQQWYNYQNMQAPMPRPYPQYPPPLLNPPYPVQHGPTSLSPRANATHQGPSSSSLRSHPNVLSPPPQDRVPPPPSAPSLSIVPSTPAPPPITRRMPFYPPLPWYSVSENKFPIKGYRRRKRRPLPQSSSQPVELPSRAESPLIPEDIEAEEAPAIMQPPQVDNLILPVPGLSNAETPTTSQAPSETDSTQPTTPSSAAAPRNPTVKPVTRQPSKIQPVIPAVPYLPSLPRTVKDVQGNASSDLPRSSEVPATESSPNPSQSLAPTATDAEIAGELAGSEETSKAASPQIRAPPKSWADLVRTKGPVKTQAAGQVIAHSDSEANGFEVHKGDSLADILSSFNVRQTSENKISFLKPRGLVNTGNMCYMNAVLQILVFCIPFYDFLDQVGKRATHSFKSDTPMVDAMIMFMREFPIIDSAVSAEQLRLRLKDNELEQYGEAFTPEFVYEVIRRIPRFSSMRRGHQQDAEEFLGFLLEEMHDECVKAIKGPTSKISSTGSPHFDDSKSVEGEHNASDGAGWLEVGPKQRAAITRSSGILTTESPITKIFGGKLRSELRVPGAKNSVTLEPYQPLQLDIGSPQVNNIIEALKGLTRSETLHGDFNSPRGPTIAATKQVFIETLPPVLILHLKRFQYDNAGGTQKIWKKIGYPLELEIPKEVFPQHKRGSFAAHGGLPHYRLIGVVYHHGKNASGGHYTVDVRRQDEREWIRLDDTTIRRVRSEDVAEGGSEEDPKILAAALEQHNREQSASSIFFDQDGEESDETTEAEAGWSQVNGSSSNAPTGAKKWSAVANGSASPIASASSGKRTPLGRYSIKDNKVAYLLFYQKIGF